MYDKPKQWKINLINDLLYTFDSGTLSSIYKALLSIKEGTTNGRLQKRDNRHN